ncbi:citrate (Si)-synthase [Yeosuana sp. MJ-SS3]|uniref:citrate synthase (unknown stereospecificity) n=1 Tax=Gilvirhabdus luticola TaxID=3079858 RepID=A0ABU3U6A7_9FLAO|nr:citrate (Si)-synthase [Yeosuana sp. MJ-SS3]MDU8885938.1 citrate (Si)-synthase [Yeosuana sp. MJ-SS3]
MSTLKEKLHKKIIEHRPRTTKLLKDYGDKVIAKVTVEQVIGGMRGIKSLITDISYLDPYEGIRYRGYTLQEVLKKLPKAKGAEMPYVEGLYYLLLTGEIPAQNEVEDLIIDFNNRRIVPRYVWDVIDSFPSESHPMAILSAAVMSLERESHFNIKYKQGMNKKDYWNSTYEDATNLLAKMPLIGAYIYNKLYHPERGHRYPDPSLDFGANFAYMMGKDKPYDDVSRMYFIIHADHESGNVSAHTGHLVASSLSDVYYATSAMINGLAGPLHGLANQEVLRWLQGLIDLTHGKLPSKDELKAYVWKTLNSGQVIPGYGHAVLRKTDPRYTVQREFCLKHLPNDNIFKYVDALYNVVPDILKEHGKAKNPWPNVDAQSGVVQWHYGVTQYDFYTVLFAIGRSIGVLSNIIWDRALGYPLERPKSITTNMLEEMVQSKEELSHSAH